MAELPKPLSAAQLAVSALGLLKTAAVVFVMMLLELTRKQKAMAEKGKAVAETDLSIEKQLNQIKDADAKKTPSAIIDDFLDQPKPGG